MKRCHTCRTWKALSEFHIRSASSDGRQPNCKPCTNAAEKERCCKKRRLLKAEVYAAYGNVCECCGENTPEFLSIDHINNDGKIERKAGLRGYDLHLHLRKLGYPKDRYRLLCFNCNMARAFFGVCPHQRNKLGVA